MEHSGEKTEQASPKRMEEAIRRGQFARSPEIQTVFVLTAGLMALRTTGPEIWRQLASAQIYLFGHLGDIPINQELMPGYAVKAAAAVVACAGPVVMAAASGGLLAGGIQSRFQTATDALEFRWERLNPVEGFQRIFSARALTPAAVSLVKLGLIGTVCYHEVKKMVDDPVFFMGVDLAGIAAFLDKSAFAIATNVGMMLMLIAGVDYAYQFWRNKRDLMMTKEEVKEEMKSAEGNPHLKARMRRRRTLKSQRQMLVEVPKADVIVTNPTHISIALRYDRKTMKAPQIVAKGIRLNALKIREIAKQHQVPIIENKPLARLMFRHGRVGGEIPAPLYAAVAEVLAYVYRINRYRYHAELNKA